jgi:hypothetical protein
MSNYGYIYKVTCFNELIYIGQHKSEYFDPKYLGSGVNLNRTEIKSIEIIEFCNEQNINERENYFINLYESYKPEKGLNVKVSIIHIENKQGIQNNNLHIGKVNNELIGKYIHILENDLIDKQGQIIDIRDNNVLIQLFSFFTGDPTIIINDSFDNIFSNKYRIYACKKSFLTAYMIQMNNDGLLKGSVEYNVKLQLDS